MRIIFSKLANQELDDAARFYEMEFEGLGKRFRYEAKKAAIRISEYPEAWSVELGEVRNRTGSGLALLHDDKDTGSPFSRFVSTGKITLSTTNS